jgi:hypothetical protein
LRGLCALSIQVSKPDSVFIQNAASIGQRYPERQVLCMGAAELARATLSRIIHGRPPPAIDAHAMQYTTLGLHLMHHGLNVSASLPQFMDARTRAVAVQMP